MCWPGRRLLVRWALYAVGVFGVLQAVGALFHQPWEHGVAVGLGVAIGTASVQIMIVRYGQWHEQLDQSRPDPADSDNYA